MTKQEGSGQGRSYKSLCYCTNLRRSSNIISDFYDASLKPAGLTVAQYFLLITLSRLKSANITHWAEHVGLERSTMVRNIKLLQNRDFVKLTEGQGKVYVLSEKGEEVLRLAVPLWQQAQSQIEAILGKCDAEAIYRINEKLQRISRQNPID